MGAVKIFVGNVQTDSTPEAEGELRAMFEQYGKVLECDILTGKNYGFVHMASESDANIAIENLNGAEFYGGNINVELSGNQSKGKTAPRGGRGGRGGFGRGGPRGAPRGRGRGGPDRAGRGRPPPRYDPYGRDPYGGPPGRDPYDRYPPPPRDPYDPYARDPYARDPYARDPYARDPYARDPYARDPYARDPYARDPYARDPYARDPYARLPPATDPYARPPPEYYERRAPAATGAARDPYERADEGDRGLVAYPAPKVPSAKPLFNATNGGAPNSYTQPQLSSLYTSFD